MSIGDAVSVGSTIYGILSPPIFRQCGYILFCNSHVSDLKSEIQKLKDAAARVQHSVDESRSAGEFIHEDVLTWLNNADQRIELGNRILETNKVGRVVGFVPNPKACHKLGRNAKKAIPDFQKLCSEGGFDKVSYHRVEEQSLIVGSSTSSQRNYVALKSRTAVLKFVMEALDDDKIGAIGVYGMGGVGKTTLLKEVENRTKELKRVDVVVSVFVSQTPNLTAIRAEIDYRLKRLVSSDASRKTVLILFDDLWKPLDLKGLGVPESNNKLKVKLVMTSRNKHLLIDEMSCQRTFSVGVLDVEEAWRFFAVLVSSKVEDLKGKPAAVAFLKKCAGLPVSIEALATLWKKKKMDSSSNDLSEDELEHVKETPDGFVSLELSYNSLEDGDEENQAKLVFRTIGLLNTPKVLILTLIKYMVGLGLFGNSTSYNIVERARMEITRSLHTLQESSLLLESEDNDHIKIHDVVRDVAVRIASREDHALIFDPLKGVKEWSTKKLEECRAVALTSSIALELHKEGWNSPDLNIFVLEAGDEQGDQHVELPNAKNMEKLRVMHLKNAQITSLTSSINLDYLKNLTTLCLDNCCLEDITAIGKLVTLQVLSLTGSDLAKLPEEIGKLINLRMLDLSKCLKLEFIQPGILERLTKLEELYLRESFDKWENKGDNGGNCNASLEELNSMPWLRTLEVRIPDTSKLPQNLPLGDLVQSKVLMGESWDWSGDYNESRTLKLEVKWDSMINEEWFQSSLQRAQDLYLEGLNGTSESFHELCREGFEELKHLHLQNCSSIVCIIWSLEWLECNSFTTLESMVLKKMGRLEKICNGRIDSSSFSKLKVVRVEACHELTSLFNLSLLKNLTELEEIEISDCEMVRQIILAEQVKDDEDVTGEELHNVGMNGCSDILFGRRPAKTPTKDAKNGGVYYKIEKLLGKLRYLTLRNLPEITTFFTAQIGPSDESMETTVVPAFFNDQKVLQLPKYKEIQSTTHLELDKLQRIELTECNKVVQFTNSKVLLKLVNLESLTIAGCESLEDIFDLEGIELESGNVEILPKLYELKLRELPKLEHIWKKNLKQKIKGCRKLRAIEIYNCDKLLYLSSSFMCEGMESLTEINVGNCDKMETIFLDSALSVKTQLTSLKILAISYCSNLKAFLSDLIVVDSSTANCCYREKSANPSNSFFSQKVFLPSLESLILDTAGKFEKLWCWEIPDKSYCKLEYLHLKWCQNLLTAIPASMIERLHNLRQLWIIRCEKLDVVFDLDVDWKTKKKPMALMLPQLQQVKLECLLNLSHVVEGGFDDEIVVGFPKLKQLEVYGCNKLINLISTTTTTSLLELKIVTIDDCSGLLEVIGGKVSERYKRNAIILRHLTSLSLMYLPNLVTFFSSESHQFDFTGLKILRIYACTSLEKLIKPPKSADDDEDQADTTIQVLFDDKVQLPNLEELYISKFEVIEALWNEPPTAGSFCKLKVLNIYDCPSLQSIIPSFMVNRLQNMERISISDCNSLQDIFKTNSSTKQIQSSSHDSGESSSQALIIAFTKLTSLKLEGNMQLNNLWLGSYTLETTTLKIIVLYRTNGATVEAIMEKVYLPNLEELEICSEEITKLWHAEPHAITSFNKLKRLQVEECGDLENIIPFFMLKRLHNLETLVVKECNNLEIACEIKWLIDRVQEEDSESSKLVACFIPFPNLASVHVEKCERLISLFSISGQHLPLYEETADDFYKLMMQLPQLTYLKLNDLPNFSHLLFQQAEQYTLELSSLKECILTEIGDKLEAVMQKVAFPEKLDIQTSDSFFVSITSVVTDIVKGLQENQGIIGLLGSMGYNMLQELHRQTVVKEEATNLFNQAWYSCGSVYRIQADLGRKFGIVYGEANVQGRAKRLRKTMLSYIRNKRLLLILAGLDEEKEEEDITMTLEAVGIPSLDGSGGFDPKHFKILLVSEDKELLLKKGAQRTIPIGLHIGERLWIFQQELEDSREAFPTLLLHQHPAFDDTSTDICSFVGPTTVLFNNIMNSLRDHQNNDQIIGMLGSTNEDLFKEVRRLLEEEEDVFDEVVEPDDNEVETIQENLETALGIITNENRAQCIRQTLISTSSSNHGKKRLLLILSDLDRELDLEAVGIHVDDGMLDPNFFKIFFISYNRQVLQKMGAQQVFEIVGEKEQVFELGSEADYRHTFCRILDGYVGNFELSKLVDECGSDDNLATLLVKKLKSQGMHAWANAFRRLKDSPFVYEERKKVIDSL